jgi:hypothetical protein
MLFLCNIGSEWAVTRSKCAGTRNGCLVLPVLFVTGFHRFMPILGEKAKV